ncbi:MAG: hypothetical protein HYZ50_14905 [Deltaproteobacteria bacterium]|nr:hypothetical protein [Deltaproteobacteria bacterium]
MNVAALLWSVVLLLALPSWAVAITPAAPLSDREVIERLARLEEGQKALQDGQNVLRQEVKTQGEQFRQDMQKIREEIKAQGERFSEEMRQLRTDMYAQFSFVFQLIIGILGAFAAIIAVTITFALWDRRTMIRPFESKVKTIEEEIATNRQRLHTLLEALRTLSRKDKQVADVLKQFDLL